MITFPFVLCSLLIVTWTQNDLYVQSAGCEDIQSLMDATEKEDCSAIGMVTRGGSICVPKMAGPLLLFYRHLSSQPLAMRSFSQDAQDEQLMIGYYPKLDKCFLVRRTQCQIKAAAIDALEPRIFWIEMCPPSKDDYDQFSPTKINLHRINLDGTGHEWTPFAAPLENWYTISLTLDLAHKKVYVVTYQETFECDLSGGNCVSLDRPSEGTLLTSRMDQP